MGHFIHKLLPEKQALKVHVVIRKLGFTVYGPRYPHDFSWTRQRFVVAEPGIDPKMLIRELIVLVAMIVSR